MKSSISLYFVFATSASLLLGVVLGYALGAYEYTRPGATAMGINSFTECAAKYPVMESYPRQCNTPDGKHFVEDVKAVPPTQPPKETAPNTDPDQPQASAKDGCVVGGCSAQLCGEAGQEPLVSTCEYRAEYSCYKFATCEKQSTGKCGWTQTSELKSCLKNPPPLI